MIKKNTIKQLNKKKTHVTQPNTMKFDFLDKQKYSTETVFMNEFLTSSLCKQRPLTISELDHLKHLSLKLSQYKKQDVIFDLITQFTLTLTKVSKNLQIDPKLLFNKIFELFAEKDITKELPTDNNILFQELKITDLTNLTKIPLDPKINILLNYIIYNINLIDNYN